MKSTTTLRLGAALAVALVLASAAAEAFAAAGRGGRGGGRGGSVGAYRGGSVRQHGRSSSSARRSSARSSIDARAARARQDATRAESSRRETERRETARRETEQRRSERREAASRSAERTRETARRRNRDTSPPRSFRHSAPEVPDIAGARARSERGPLGTDALASKHGGAAPASVSPDGRRLTTRQKAFRGGVLDQLPESNPTKVGDRTYYRYKSYCYQRVFHNGRVRWVGCRPPPGFHVPELPPGAKYRLWRNLRRWNYGGVWYGEDDDGYEVVEDPDDLAEEDDDGEGDEVGDDQNPFPILQAASDLLKQSSSLQFEVDDSWDEIGTDLTKVRRHGHRSVSMVRPDRFRADFSGDEGDRTWLFADGKLKLVDRKASAWGEVAAGKTIDEAIDFASENLGVNMPLADFLSSDLYGSVEPNVTNGFLFGTVTIGTAECHHIAFEGTWLDAELWITTGGAPLVQQLVLTYKKDQGRPKYTANFKNWKLGGDVSAGTFKVDAPADAEKIDVLSSDEGQGGTGG